jgi:pyridoxamine 5'-phosphate oxidase
VICKRNKPRKIFPAMRLSAGKEKANVDRLLELLINDHSRMAVAWAEVRSVLLQLAKGDNSALGDTLLEKFIASYTDHIAIEEGVLFPLAERLLSPQQTEQIGQHMAERRGVKLP